MYLKSRVIDGCSIKTREGDIWKSMIQRCNSIGLHPSYDDCYVSADFLDFQRFAEWCNRQSNFGLVDNLGKRLQLDKDLLYKHNKVYSPEACVFVPAEINMFMVKRNGARGNCPIGVCYREKQNKFEANCNLGSGRQKYLGTHATPEQAFAVYKEFKENLGRELAEKYSALIPATAYNALCNYEVSIED